VVDARYSGQSDSSGFDCHDCDDTEEKITDGFAGGAHGKRRDFFSESA
jgi:hypothetical protein